MKVQLLTFDLAESSADFDWSQPVVAASEELTLKWDDEPEENDVESPPMSMKLDAKRKESNDKGDKDGTIIILSVEKECKLHICFVDDAQKSAGQLDIMAQQLKFVACLKILMEELSTLATGFEVDGGQLRYQLYVWLEREVDALRQLCSYSTNVDGDVTNASECK